MAEQIHVVSNPSSPAELGKGWPYLALFLVAGYMGLGKPFAYLGLPWISLYIGEIALLTFLFFGPRTTEGNWLSVVWRVQKLRPLKRLLLLSLFYGGFVALRGVLQGYPALTAARDTAFNYYPLFLFLGIWVGLRDSKFLCRIIRVLSLGAGCYGLAYILFLNRVPWTMPGTESRVPVFLGPYGASTVALLGLLAIESRFKEAWLLILLNLFVLLGVQVRAEWVGFAAGVLIFAWLTRKLKKLALAVSALVVLLGLMYATGMDLQTPAGRGESVGSRISAAYLVARAIAPVSRDLGEELASTEDVGFAAGTAEWRLVWWANIWGEVHAGLSSTLLGFGYGYPVGDLNPDIQPGTFMQTPHNDFLYALVFSGWLGVTLFALLQFEIGRLVWRGYRITGRPFGFICWAAFLTMSLFEDFFEAPFAAIPSYLLLGAAIAPLLLASTEGQRKTTQEAWAALPA